MRERLCWLLYNKCILFTLNISNKCLITTSKTVCVFKQSTKLISSSTSRDILVECVMKETTDRCLSSFLFIVRRPCFGQQLQIKLTKAFFFLHENICSAPVRNTSNNDIGFWYLSLSHPLGPRREKPCLRCLRTTKAQYSLPIRAVWSASLLFTFFESIISKLTTSETSIF